MHLILLLVVLVEAPLSLECILCVESASVLTPEIVLSAMTVILVKSSIKKLSKADAEAAKWCAQRDALLERRLNRIRSLVTANLGK